MIAKVLILCTVVVAVSCSGLIGTGVSAGSRVMDGHGNYAFQYGISSAGANRRRSEVGSGWAGPVKTSYAVADSHIAPAWGGHGGYGLGAVGYGGYGLGAVGYGGYGLGLGGIGLGRAGLGHAGLGCGGLGCGVGYAGVGKLI